MPTKIPTEIIHIEWEGPLTIAESESLESEKDYGVYQVCGSHPIYGGNVLVYIGKAVRQHFGTRIRQEAWKDTENAASVRVFVGRMAGEGVPTEAAWNRQIDLAERLLIYACFPAHNAQKNLGKLDADLQNLHLLNWGDFGSLLPEVSGARWTSKYDVMPRYAAFGSEPDE